VAKIEYARSIRKMLLLAIINAALLLLSIFLINHYLNESQTVLFALATVFWGGICYVTVRKAKVAQCSVCQSDLFNVLDAAENSNLEIKYCPVCGNQLD
jgi:hypothetical protein